jgi:hypothetical protein
LPEYYDFRLFLKVSGDACKEVGLTVSRAVDTCAMVAQILILEILGVLLIDLHIFSEATMNGTFVGFMVA